MLLLALNPTILKLKLCIVTLVVITPHVLSGRHNFGDIIPPNISQNVKLWLERLKFPLFNLFIKFMDFGPFFMSCLIKSMNFIRRLNRGNFIKFMDFGPFLCLV